MPRKSVYKYRGKSKPRNQKTTRPDDFDIDELIVSLTGSCRAITEILPDGMDENDLTAEDNARIDESIFCCDTCGWWMELEDKAEDGSDDCDECYREQNEIDDTNE